MQSFSRILGDAETQHASEAQDLPLEGRTHGPTEWSILVDGSDDEATRRVVRPDVQLPHEPIPVEQREVANHAQEISRTRGIEQLRPDRDPARVGARQMMDHEPTLAQGSRDRTSLVRAPSPTVGT